MMSPLYFLGFLAVLLLAQVNAHTHDELSELYIYKLQLDTDGHYTMFYSYDNDSSMLRIAVLVETTGWIGLGISPNGQMPGSDVVMGWVDRSGEPFLQDRYAYGRTTPSIDASQDWILTGGNEEGGFTTLQFERKLDTCDPNDLAINFGDTVYLIYSYHVEDPINNKQFSQHQFEGSLTVNLLGQPDTLPPLSDDVQHLDIINTNVSVPAEDTTYFCILLEIPKFIQDKTHYILKFTPEISLQSAKRVHHMQVYLCEGMNLTGHPDVGLEQQCDGISEEVRPCRGAKLLAGWAVGGTGYVFPEGLGLSFGGEDKIHTHVLLEMHYDNPDKLEDIVDSSGMRLYYTDQPPQQETGLIMVGHSVIGHMIIPPGVERYTVTGYCSQECTETFLPDDGITIYSSFFHTHTIALCLEYGYLQQYATGQEMVLRHICNGVELNPIDVNSNYDFNYQQVNYIPPVHMLPGDELILECVYNSTTREGATFGGESTKDEMCLAGLFYYPASNLTTCVTYVTPNSYDEWLDKHVPADQQHIIDVAAANNVSAVRSVFDSLDWSEESYRMFERIGHTADHRHFCVSSSERNSTFVEIIQPVCVDTPLEQTADNCQMDKSGSPALYSSVVTTVLCWMAVVLI